MIPCDTLILISAIVGVLFGVGIGWIAFAPLKGD